MTGWLEATGVLRLCPGDPTLVVEGVVVNGIDHLKETSSVGKPPLCCELLGLMVDCRIRTASHEHTLLRRQSEDITGLYQG